MEDATEEAAIRRLGGAHVAAVGLDPASQGNIGRLQRGEELRELIGRRRHVGVGEDDQVAVGGKHPGPHRGTLAGVLGADQAEAWRLRGFAGRGGLARLGLGPLGDDPRRPVATAVVDDDDLDLPGQPRHRPDIRRCVEELEELVERGTDPFGLVEGGQDDRQALRLGRAGRACRARRAWRAGLLHPLGVYRAVR